MNYYEIWVNLKDSHRDLEFCKAVDAYMGHLRSQGTIESWRVTRRKFGFGPAHLPEFHISLAFKDLSQLDAAFSRVATRSGEVERLHADVYSRVTDFVSALYRDYPDPERVV